MSESISLPDNKLLVGWAEWYQLPDLNIPAIKAKIDTGAKTSSLHAFDIHRTTRDGHDWVQFAVHPLQGDTQITINCLAPVIDERLVMSSNGHQEHRYVIQTQLVLNQHQWPIELTLSNRDPLRYRLLLGREALQKHAIIDPSKNLLQGKPSQKQLSQYYPLERS